MSTISASRDAAWTNKKLLPAVPAVSYTTVPVEKLIMPTDLFDEKVLDLDGSDSDFLLPIIASKSDNAATLVIVDGCKRARHFFNTGKTNCICGIFPDILDEKAIGLLRIVLNRKRQLHIRESVRFLNWLEKNCAGENFEVTAAALGFSATQRFDLKPLLRCEDTVLDAVAQGRLSLKAAGDLCLIGPQDRAVFLETFHNILLSQQTQREFLEWLPEIAYTRKTSVETLLRSNDIQGIIADRNLNGPQKIEAIRALLFSWKYPLYNDALKKWKKSAFTTIQSVLENQPSSQVVFVPAPAFEKNRLEIRISIAHAKAAREIFQRMAEVPEKTWSQLVYPIIT